MPSCSLTASRDVSFRRLQTALRGAPMPSRLGVATLNGANLRNIAAAMEPPPRPEPAPLQHREARSAAPAPATYASLADIEAAGFARIGQCLYKKGHAIWELRRAEDGEGFHIVRKREEREVDLRRRASRTAGAPSWMRGGVWSFDEEETLADREVEYATAETSPLGRNFAINTYPRLIVEWTSVPPGEGEEDGSPSDFFLVQLVEDPGLGNEEDSMFTLYEGDDEAEAQAVADEVIAEWNAIDIEAARRLVQAMVTDADLSRAIEKIKYTIEYIEGNLRRAVEAGDSPGTIATLEDVRDEFEELLQLLTDSKEASLDPETLVDSHEVMHGREPEESSAYVEEVREEQKERSARLERGQRVLAVRQGQVAEAIITVIHPTERAVELMFGDQQTETLPIELIITDADPDLGMDLDAPEPEPELPEPMIESDDDDVELIEDGDVPFMAVQPGYEMMKLSQRLAVKFNEGSSYRDYVKATEEFAPVAYDGSVIIPAGSVMTTFGWASLPGLRGYLGLSMDVLDGSHGNMLMGLAYGQWTKADGMPGDEERIYVTIDEFDQHFDLIDQKPPEHDEGSPQRGPSTPPQQQPAALGPFNPDLTNPARPSSMLGEGDEEGTITGYEPTVVRSR